MGRPRRDAGWGTIRFERRGNVWHVDGRFRDSSGKDRRHRAHGPTPEFAELRLRAMEKDPGTALSATTTVEELASYWLQERQSDVEMRLSDPQGRAGIAPQTLVKYRGDLESRVLPAIGTALLGELRAPELELVLRQIRSQTQAQRVRGLLRQMLDEAVRLGAIPSTPLAPARRVRQHASAPTAYSAPQLLAIRQAWEQWVGNYSKPGPKPNNDVLDALLVSVATSMRIGEVLALRPMDLALTAEPPRLAVTGTLVQVESIPLHRQHHPKDARQTRAIRLSRSAIDILRRRSASASDPEAPLWPASGVRTTTLARRAALLGDRADDQPWLSPHNVRAVIRAFRTDMADELRAAGIEPSLLIPKAMRSTAATAVAHALSNDHAAALAGHRSVAVTLDFYIGRLELIDGGQAQVLDDLLGNGDDSLTIS